MCCSCRTSAEPHVSCTGTSELLHATTEGGAIEARSYEHPGVHTCRGSAPCAGTRSAADVASASAAITNVVYTQVKPWMRAPVDMSTARLRACGHALACAARAASVKWPRYALRKCSSMPSDATVRMAARLSSATPPASFCAFETATDEVLMTFTIEISA